MEGEAWAAWTALTLSVITLLVTWLRNRQADVVAWLERRGDNTYCVLENRGRADARKVTVDFSSTTGKPLDLATAEKWPLPLGLLASGDVLYLSYIHYPGTLPMVIHADVSWRDRRLWKPGQQTATRATGVRPVTDPPPRSHNLLTY